MLRCHRVTVVVITGEKNRTNVRTDNIVIYFYWRRETEILIFRPRMSVLALSSPRRQQLSRDHREFFCIDIASIAISLPLPRVRERRRRETVMFCRTVPRQSFVLASQWSYVTYARIRGNSSSTRRFRFRKSWGRRRDVNNRCRDSTTRSKSR